VLKFLLLPILLQSRMAAQRALFELRLVGYSVVTGVNLNFIQPAFVV